ncbi:MAG: hypothetical protein MOB07_19980 [Acidobacteria bacterium]|nr:hypothetical protein [Acidobacteriota bacterium]
MTALTVAYLRVIDSYSEGRVFAGFDRMMTAAQMSLGEFSISLTVKDLKRSQQFYEKLGFQRVDGRNDLDGNLILIDELPKK